MKLMKILKVYLERKMENLYSSCTSVVAGVVGEGVDAETLECGGGAWNDDEVGAHVVAPVDANPRGVKEAARNDEIWGALGDHTVTRSEAAWQAQEQSFDTD